MYDKCLRMQSKTYWQAYIKMSNNKKELLKSLLTSWEYILCSETNQAEIVEAIDEIGKRIHIVLDESNQKAYISLEKSSFSWYSGSILTLERDKNNIWKATK